MDPALKVKISRYVSYLLRHNPENLGMDKYGFVDLTELLEKITERFQSDKISIVNIVEESDRKRFEIVENKIRALYGHTMPVILEFEEDKTVKTLYHGTTHDAASEIVKIGLKPMKRRWVHLSPTIKIAVSVGLRRTENPVVLQIDAETARKNGTRFYKATDAVYLCTYVQPEHVKRVI